MRKKQRMIRKDEASGFRDAITKLVKEASVSTAVARTNEMINPEVAKVAKIQAKAFNAAADYLRSFKVINQDICEEGDYES